jgi:hypothetical protein
MFQAQEQAEEDGLRRVEASRTDADLGTLLATCPECRLLVHVARVPSSVSDWAITRSCGSRSIVGE